MKLRRVLQLAVVGAAAAAMVDRALGERTAGTTPPATMAVRVHAPIDEVWRVLVDHERQPLWMSEMKELRLIAADRLQLGATAQATVRIGGIAVTDPVTVTAFDPPTRFAIAHEGLYSGEGEITLVPDGDDWTEVSWVEHLRAPLVPHLAAAVQNPVFRMVFQADLVRFKRLVETGSAEGDDPPLVRLLTL